MLKTNLRCKILSIGSWLTLAHPSIAEIVAKAGFDWLAVDLEHSVITIREAEELIRVIDLCGVAPLVRLTSNDPNQIKRIMDAGAHGVIVPMVNSAKEAQQAVDSVYYAPLGKRGVGLARAQGYGAKFNEYRQWLAENTVVVVQIEHIDAVKNIESILSVSGIDAYIVGPYDLSSSMGLIGQLDHPEVEAAIRHVDEVAKRLDVPGGMHIVEPEQAMLAQRIKEGFKFLAYSLDTRLLDVGVRTALDSVRGKYEKNSNHTCEAGVESLSG